MKNPLSFEDSFQSYHNSVIESGIGRYIFPIPFADFEILPALLGNVQDADLLPLLLPNIFAITKSMSQLSFSERVLPTVTDIIKSKDLPDNVTITLLDSIPHLKEKTTGKEFADGKNSVKDLI
jgi:hypothetical protein